MADKKKGYGTYYYKNSGDVYEGEWDNNMKSGRGKYKYTNGDLYEGSFSESMKDGRGRF